MKTTAWLMCAGAALLLCTSACGDDDEGTDAGSVVVPDVADDVLVPDVHADDAVSEDVPSEDVPEPDAVPPDAVLPDSDEPDAVPPDGVEPPECEEDADCKDVLGIPPCHVPRCNTDTSTCEPVPAPDGTLCDDGDPTTCDDACTAGECAGTGCPAEMVEVKGTVWRYACMFCDAGMGSGQYYMEPMGAAVIETVGLAEAIETTSSNEDCASWWVPGSDAMCGQFTLKVPKGAKLALRASAPDDAPQSDLGLLPGLGSVFVAGEQPYHILVVAQQQLVTTLQTAWGIEAAPDTGLLAGIVSKWDPSANPIYTEFIGGATVQLEPAAAADSLVYFDSADPKSTKLEATDAKQPIFFVSNLAPKGVDDPYALKTQGGGYLYDQVDFAVEAGAITFVPIAPSSPVADVELLGRVWNYWANGIQLTYDYPMSPVDVLALNGGASPLATSASNTEDCTPWSPSDPYMCGTFSMALGAGQEIMLKATNNMGYKDTLSGIFEVTGAQTPILVMVHENVVGLLSTTWGVEMDPEKGHVAGIVAVGTEGGIGDAPFEELVGEATVEVTPAPDGEAPTVVYYDSSNPASTTLEATDPKEPIFVVLNLEPRPFGDPYQIVVSHPTKAFPPQKFAVEADALTYLIASPKK